MQKLQQLIELCKCEINISINPHRNYYETVEEYLKDSFDGLAFEETDNAVIDEMIKRDTIVQIQYYPNTPIGFNVQYHYNIDMALDAALEQFKVENV